MSDDFSIKVVVERESVSMARVTGRLDARTAPRLMTYCDQVVEEKRNLVLVLSEVSFLSSAGVGVLLAVSELFQEAGRSVRLANLSQAVSTTIKLLNLDRFLPIDQSETESLAELESKIAGR